MSSVLDEPVSLPASRSGVAGVAGAAVSMVTVRTPEAALTFNAVFVAMAVIWCVPSARATPLVIDHVPVVALAATVPREPVTSENNSTVLSGSAVPENVGVVTLVRSSVFDNPESLTGSRSGVDGGLGGVMSTILMTTSLLSVPPAYVIVAVSPEPRKSVLITAPSANPANVPLTVSVPSLLIITYESPPAGT